jgi:hypothetical protein
MCTKKVKNIFDLSLLILIPLFIIGIICLILYAYGPWLPTTQSLSSLDELPYELPINFKSFPAKGKCIWSRLSYHKKYDVLWGEHTGLCDIAKWKINFFIFQGFHPDINIEPNNFTRSNTIIPEEEFIKIFIDTTNQALNESHHSFHIDDLGMYNVNLSGEQGVIIVQFSQTEGRKYISCFVNEKIFVFVFRL